MKNSAEISNRVMDAAQAAAHRLLVPHDDPEERRNAISLAAVTLSDAILSMQATSKELCRAGRSDIADLADDARRSMGALESLIVQLEQEAA